MIISPKCLAILLPLVVLKPPTLYIGSFKMVLLPKLNGFVEICNLFWISNMGDNNINSTQYFLRAGPWKRSLCAAMDLEQQVEYLHLVQQR